MRIFSGTRVLSFLVVLYLFGAIFGSASLKKKKSKSDKMTTRKRSFIALLFTTNASFFDPEAETGRHLCRWLKGLRHQRKLCQRKTGLPEVLQQTRRLALTSCQNEFKYAQWNCSTSHMKRFFKKIYRETAFMYSLAASAFVYVVAQACVEGKLANCKCASHEKSDKPNEWEWGECSVNTRSASRFVQNFLQLKGYGDNPDNIMKYNSEVGVKVVRNKVEKTCKCHGLSGACTHKICYMSLKPFAEVTRNLKQLYHRAIQIEPNNNVRDIHKHPVKKQLVFLDSSPNFCDTHRNGGLSTVGRQCRDIDNCATLCCSNGYTTSTKLIREKCNCFIKNNTLVVSCQTCIREEKVYHCQ